MRRRELVTLLGGAAIAWPLAVRAQHPAMPVIGFLHSTSATAAHAQVAAFQAELAKAGFVEGKTVRTEFRWGEGHYKRLPALAIELVRLHVAVLFAGGATAQIAKAATTTIPIVFVTGEDPVADGLVASLNRPGGNLTGVNLISADLEAKRLDLLHQLVPHVAQIGVLINPAFPFARHQSHQLEVAARAIGQKLLVLKATRANEIDAAFMKMANQHVGAIIVGSDPYLFGERARLIALAERYAIPTMYQWRAFAVAGGLMSYGPNIVESYQQAGNYTARLLKGENPANLPVLQPTRFHLVINLKTAKSLALTVPPTMLALADEVIE